MPDGTRRLSSSTTHRPGPSLTRSTPQICARTAADAQTTPLSRNSGCAVDHLAGHDAVTDDLPLAVDVRDEQVEALGTLGQPGLSAAQSAAPTMRGTRSIGNSWAAPYR